MKLLPQRKSTQQIGAERRALLRSPVMTHPANRKLRAYAQDKWARAARAELKGQDRIAKELAHCAVAGLSTKDVLAALKDARDTKLGMLQLCKSRGRAKGGGQSSKAKGRSAVVLVQKLLLKHFDLTEADVFVKATSQGGCDVHLSRAAASLFPFGIEVKNAETLSIWKALAQATVNANKKKVSPVLFFKRANSPLYVALRADDFVRGLPEA